MSGGPEAEGLDINDDQTTVDNGDDDAPVEEQPPTPIPVAPVITTQPLSQTVTVGDPFSLTVVAMGTAPLSYQWFKNSTSLGASHSAATEGAAEAQLSDAGDYYVVVTNAAGSVSSAVATVTTTEPVPSGGLASPTNTKRPIGTLYDKKGFWEYLPKDYGGSVPRPLLVFFHGLGEDGSGSDTDLNKVSTWGPPQLIAEGDWPVDRPFVVLSPQQQSGCPSADDVHDFLEFALEHYDVDTSRVYVTGLSCGAIGLASYFAKYGSDAITAAVLIAGDITPAWNAQGCDLVAEMPLWVFHGDADNTVSYAGDHATVPKLQFCMPVAQVSYTIYPGVDHIESWVITYDLSAGHDIYTWMMAFTR